jgi:hypothetical protein
MGCKGSQVQILSPRPIKTVTYGRRLKAAFSFGDSTGDRLALHSRVISNARPPMSAVVQDEPQHAATPPGPCDDCRHHNRCLTGKLACEAFAIYQRYGSQPLVKIQRWSYAARQPSSEIFERIRTAPKPVSAAEQRRRREALAVKMQRDYAEL